ncbi:MAG TPA: alpha/beta hydrolase [Flavihumibacter sp.]|jgi:pimeloyl-ACP methyl ester carboxylesterase
MKKSFLILAYLVLVWLLIAPGCYTFRTADKKAIAGFREKGVLLKTATVSVEDHPLHYAQTGDDHLPTLVFIHGTPGSWTAFSDYLADSLLQLRYRLISIDRPGFGYSRFGAAINLRQQSQLLGPLIARFRNGESLYLVGHSLGGPLVLQLALDFPELATGLVLISGSIDPAAEKPERWRYVLDYSPLKCFLPGAFKPSNRELIYLKTDLKKLEPQLNEIRLPIWFIHGRSDTWVPPVNVEFGLKKLSNTPSIDTLWLEGGHFIPWTAFPAIRDKLLQLPIR